MLRVFEIDIAIYFKT